MNLKQTLKRSFFIFSKNKQNKWNNLKQKSFWNETNYQKWDYKEIDLNFPA
jgi:hypothetical protein